MILKKSFRYVVISLCVIGCLTGCSNDKNIEEEKKEDIAKGKCTVTECIKQLEPSNSIEEMNEIIGFEATNSS